jgi:hypothetical protein
LAISSPFYIINLIFTKKIAVLGKLSVVNDQAGKARVVAITNWWYQQSLKPLHDAIFRVLKTLPQDGTFDQSKPINRLLATVEASQKLYGFDLSAATDRIPVQLQKDILTIIGYDGDTWMKMLSIP